MSKSTSTSVQLKRIRGQIDGIIEMFGEDRGCIEIVRQIIAARNSLTSVARGILSDEAMKCSKERRIEDLDAVLAEVFKY
jgi:DNA-binding FrmR family transcriptional regulator